MRFEVRLDNTLQVFNVGTTTNKKIAAEKEKIVQTYTYSRSQYDYILGHVRNDTKPNFAEFYLLANTNCLDCPFSTLQNGGCYTHKLFQYSGFVSQLKSIARKFGNFENIPTYGEIQTSKIVDICKDRFVRFGTYGEPVLIPISLVGNMAKVAKSYTGYTHQWKKPMFKLYAQYFMASVHTPSQVIEALSYGYRSFIAITNKDHRQKEYVNCPASIEMGFKTNCSKCGLCSGTMFKNQRSVAIDEH